VSGAVRLAVVTADETSSRPPAWGFIEAWLLLSIGDHGRRGCTLSRMIASADARNHDIPSEEAAAVALGRLESSGLVVTDGGRLVSTEQGRQIRKKRSGGWWEESSSLLPFLAEVPCREGRHYFEPGEYESAYKAYAGT